MALFGRFEQADSDRAARAVVALTGLWARLDGAPSERVRQRVEKDFNVLQGL